MSRRKNDVQDWLAACLSDSRPPEAVSNGMWRDVDAEIIHDSIAAITESGAAMLFGTTTDGGAMSCLILYGTNKHRFYEASPDVMGMLLDRFCKAYTAAQNGH